MRAMCRTCDEGRHADCNGFAQYIDQDGHSTYTCECYCRAQVNAERERERRIARVRRLIRDLGLDRTHELTEKARTDAR